MVFAMLEHADFAATDLSSLKLVLTGGTIITPVFVRVTANRSQAGVPVMFGQTEAGGARDKTLRSNPVEVIAGTGGRPYPYTAMRIASVRTGKTHALGEPGENCIRPP